MQRIRESGFSTGRAHQVCRYVRVGRETADSDPHSGGTIAVAFWLQGAVPGRRFAAFDHGSVETKSVFQAGPARILLSQSVVAVGRPLHQVAIVRRSTLYRSRNRSSSPLHALHLLPPTPDPQSRQTMNGTGSGSLVTQAIGAPNTRRQTEAQGGAAGGGAADGVRSSAADAAHGQLQLLNDRVYHANGLS